LHETPPERSVPQGVLLVDVADQGLQRACTIVITGKLAIKKIQKKSAGGAVSAIFKYIPLSPSGLP
jgi:hypothetical protein